MFDTMVPLRNTTERRELYLHLEVFGENEEK